METSSFTSVIMLLILILNTTLIPSSSATFSNITTDQSSLLAFKNAITSDPHAVLTKNWSTNTSACHWIGISCTTKHQRVKAINLSGLELEGKISPHLGNLTFLQSMDISSNNFIGSIPFEISNLRRLKWMNLGINSLTGEIPSGIFNISSLNYVDLSENRLSGSIPTFGNLLVFEELYLNDNNLTGCLPKQVENLTSLKVLKLGSNKVTGSVPKQVGNLTSLEQLDLASNRLTGELPEELGNLAHLEVFAVPFNDNLFGSIPSSIFNISTLMILALQQNQFSGSLPSNMGLSLFSLEELYLFYNRLSGKIPSSVANASKLNILELNKNFFSGLIPDFGNLKLLRKFRIWENNLTGTESQSPSQELGFLSSLTNCRNLKYLEISDNPLNGVLPTSLGNLSTSLILFAASSCEIEGVIPLEIEKLSNLLALDLSKNKLTGIIPTTIGKLKQLERLHLYDNKLRGYIPNDLCQLSHLGNLYLQKNMLTGSIPECLGNLDSLRKVFLNSNKLNSTLPSKLWNLRDLVALNLSSNYLSGRLSSQVGSLKMINRLDLSSNQFLGEIPSSIEGCQSMQNLSLSNNNFGGSIPQSLGKLRGLTTLDLSNNSLNGSIPKSLEELRFLDYFNVSYNQLKGEIPNGGHFGNFTAESFGHNSALCGATRFGVPPCTENHGRSRSKTVAFIMKYIFGPFILAIILVVVIVLLIRRGGKQNKVPPSANDILGGISWRKVSKIELQRATFDFCETNLLGKGGFGSVYKARLADGLDVAVKVFNLQLERAVRSFSTECEILSSVRHRNLVKIIGCCSNTEFKALILAYMPNWSLEKWLYSDGYFLDLLKRLEIAIDVALALEYLHHGHTFPVIHCDIKPNNVLLDKDMVAHVSDFGLAKIFDDGEAMTQTITLATIGYAAPEYGMEGKVLTSGDVYSYGIMLLEIFTGKKPTDDIFTEEISLKKWVSEALHKNTISEVVASGLLSREDENFSRKEQCVSSICDLAMKCLAFSPGERINMIQVVAALQKIKANVKMACSKRG